MNKRIYVTNYTDHYIEVITDLDDDEINSIDGLTVTERFGESVIIDADSKYSKMDLIKKLKGLVENE